MKADLQALAKMLLPLSEAEAEALAALDWLERDANLPDSIKAYFWDKLERAAEAVLPVAEREPLGGRADVSLYRTAFNQHFARRRALREGDDEAQ